ncbi:glycoside hydrolase family 3 N-terminal domain-containing protein [Synechococcus sp. MU1611]|uniref:glycoside hydrolase family 3 N-terminal domain-containing protein n=1 Tax=Synechococcus sp. MU1611 TaxID=2508345 RepID=UPI001CF8A5D4|nr:glycoside hydrolase family 3 N-terminal domain-containing protein [Synechococcus sp. MU1611]MCB4411113.1 glycosyl hydrolase family 3 [Synechococcus sp. MU1611]
MNTPASSNLRRQVAELLVLRASGHLSDHQRRYPQWELPNGTLQRLLQEGVGGVILLGGSAVELQQRTQQLQGWSSQRLLFCADVEEGVGQRFEGASWLVPPLALGRLYRGDPELAMALSERYGRCTGEQARRCGLNWVLGPVCDVNNNPANPVINVRAWGEDPSSAGALAVAFQRGLSQADVLGCAKHFPGHGDTASDSHLDLPVLPHSRERLEQVELPPFRAAIAAGIDSVMTAHLLLPELDPEQPATLSKAVLSDLLRRKMGFNGLVVTDALVMEAISARHGAAEAAVLAFDAGADLILMPADADAAIDGLCAGFNSGRLPLERLEESRQRRAHALQSIPISAPSGPIVTAADQALEAELVRHSVTIRDAVVRADAGINLVRVDSLLPSAAALSGWSPALRIPETQGFRSVVLHGEGLSPWSGQPEAPLALEGLGNGPVMLQLFLRGNPFRAGRDAQEPWAAAIQQLVTLNRLAGVVIYGSPYLWESLQPILPSGCPAAYSAGQMQEAQRQVLTALFPTSSPASGGGAFTD